MVKNTIGGKYHKRQKKKTDLHEGVRDFPWPDNELTHFGIVTTMFGSNMVEVKIGESVYKTRIPGSFRKKVWIGKGDLVMVHYDKECNVSEITFVYKPQEVDLIKSMGMFDDAVDDEEENTENVVFTSATNNDEIDVDQI